MKIAVASEQGVVSAHFGHCAEFALFTVGPDGKINEKTIIPNPGHQPGFLPGYLAQKGVTHILAGGMGQRAQELFAGQGIVPVLGVSGAVDRVVEDFLANRLVTGASTCEHGHGHGDGTGACRHGEGKGGRGGCAH